MSNKHICNSKCIDCIYLSTLKKKFPCCNCSFDNNYMYYESKYNKIVILSKNKSKENDINIYNIIFSKW